MTEKYIECYREISKIPEVRNAKILSISEEEQEKTSISIQVEYGNRDLSEQKLQISYNHYLVQGERVFGFPSSPTDPNVVLHSVSPCGGRTAFVLQNDTLRKLTVADTEGTAVNIDLSNELLHGKLYCDPYISCLEWSSDGKKLAFVAEAKRKPASSFYSGDVNNAEEERGEQNLFFEDWGEQMTGQHQGVVVVVDIESASTKVFNLPEEMTPGQLVWRPTSDDVIGVAYPSKPFRIGIAYCSDRESVLFQIDSRGNYEELTPRGQHVKSPRFSPNGEKLIFLQSSTYGSRAPTAQIAMLSWQTKKTRVLMDYVDSLKPIEDGTQFAGVCGKTALPRRCFNAAQTAVVFSAFYLNNTVVYHMDLESTVITELTASNRFCTALDLHKDRLLILTSSMTIPDRLYVSDLRHSETGPVVRNLIPVTPDRTVDGVREDWVHLWMTRSPVPDKEGKEHFISTMFVGPAAGTGESPKRPLICWPHGGPHSLVANRFCHMYAFYVSLGYSLVFPNYRGSIGHGNDFLTASLGQCGQADVHDCFLSIEECCKRFGDVVDCNRISLIGFSHGGFLALHLAAKHPSRFQSIATLNAASDIYIMAAISDIPEWAYLEYGLPFSLGRRFDMEAVNRMFERSPVNLVDNIKAPTLILLGKKDVRVPPAQGLNFYRLLRARNIPTKVYMYDDDHPLKKIQSESDYVIQIAKWFQEHSKSEPQPN